MTARLGDSSLQENQIICQPARLGDSSLQENQKMCQSARLIDTSRQENQKCVDRLDSVTQTPVYWRTRKCVAQKILMSPASPRNNRRVDKPNVVKSKRSVDQRELEWSAFMKPVVSTVWRVFDRRDNINRLLTFMFVLTNILYVCIENFNYNRTSAIMRV